jgi:glycerophosphoryl diester phosphodiesterase
VAYASLIGVGTVTAFLLEQAVVMLVAARAGVSGRRGIQSIVSAFVGKMIPVLRLGALQAAFLALCLVPVLGALYATYQVLLTRHDIYFYTTVRPPAFWLAAGIGFAILLVGGAIAACFYVRWSLALPIVLHEGLRGRHALRESAKRVRGRMPRVGWVALGWPAGVFALGLAGAAVFRWVAATVMDLAGDQPFGVILALLAVQALLLTSLSLLMVIGNALLIRRVYLDLSDHREGPEAESAPSVRESKDRPSGKHRRIAAVGLVLLALSPIPLWFGLSRSLPNRTHVKVTAHRGHARIAPENTWSAVRKAIEIGADYVEIDVQPTSDGVIVLLHDRDLKRVAGLSRAIDDVSYAEVRQLDVGRWFSAEFTGEKVPTLEEILERTKGRIKLNIELKFPEAHANLVPEVTRLIAKWNMEPDCLLTAFRYESLLEVKRLNPRLRTGLIIAHALGDVSRLNVDALSVRAEWLTDDVIRDAHRQGQEVHVWPLYGPRAMTQWIKSGADNLITSHPDEALRVRDEWVGLSDLERLILASRLLLGLEP